MAITSEVFDGLTDLTVDKFNLGQQYKISNGQFTGYFSIDSIDSIFVDDFYQEYQDYPNNMSFYDKFHNLICTCEMECSTATIEANVDGYLYSMQYLSPSSYTFKNDQGQTIFRYEMEYNYHTFKISGNEVDMELPDTYKIYGPSGHLDYKMYINIPSNISLSVNSNPDTLLSKFNVSIYDGSDNFIAKLTSKGKVLEGSLTSINDYSEQMLLGAFNSTKYSDTNYNMYDNQSELYLMGAKNINGTGNTSDNYIKGNTGQNKLNGVSGIDTLEGGLGNDTYIVDSDDTIIEASTLKKELDTVISSATWNLGENLENLTLSGTDNLEAYGNELNNKITGNSGDNILDGDLGADILNGGTGNDMYFVDDIKDSVVESSKIISEIDTVQSSVSFVIGNNIENLILTGSDNIKGTGNKLNNTITGNDQNNIISALDGNDNITGNEGNDTIDGGKGNDTYFIASGDGLDTITDSAGTDIIKFTTNIDTQNIALLLDKSGNLIIDYGDSAGTDQIKINKWKTKNSQIEKIQLNDGTTYLSNTDINTIIQNMTSYATTNSINLTNISDVKTNSDIMLTISTSWHN